MPHRDLVRAVCTALRYVLQSWSITARMCLLLMFVAVAGGAGLAVYTAIVRITA